MDAAPSTRATKSARPPEPPTTTCWSSAPTAWG